MRQAARVVFVAFAFLLAGNAFVFADNDFLDLASPVFLGGGGGTATLETPMGTILNPAVSADRERVTFDASYIALTQLTQSVSLGGNIVNLGVALPTRAGVFSAIGRFADASFIHMFPGSNSARSEPQSLLLQGSLPGFVRRRRARRGGRKRLGARSGSRLSQLRRRSRHPEGFPLGRSVQKYRKSIHRHATRGRWAIRPHLPGCSARISRW